MRKPGVGFEYNGTRLCGVTEYLRRNFYPQFHATRRATPHRGISRGLGMRQGTIADSAITSYAKTGNTCKMTRSPAAQRLVHFLKMNRLAIIDAHVLVCEPSVGVATEIDVLCQGRTSLVVIENKTTLQTRAEHLRTYKIADPDHPLLSGFLHSLLNNEYNHHQLQLALMLLMLRQTYNIAASGYVLMAVSDGLIHYPINQSVYMLLRDSLSNQRHFRSISFCRQLAIPSDPNILRVPYSYRPYLRAGITHEGPLPNIISVFLKKVKADLIQQPYSAGPVRFLDHGGSVETTTADIYAESSDSIYIFALRSSNYKASMVTDPASAPIVGSKKLPDGRRNTLLSAIFFELSITLRVMLAAGILKPIYARVVLHCDNKEYISRKLPTAYTKTTQSKIAKQ